MNFFGIPLYISYDTYLEWFNTYFSSLNIENGFIFIGYLIVIFIQLKLLIFIIDFVIKFLTLIVNLIKKMKRSNRWF